MAEAQSLTDRLLWYLQRYPASEARARRYLAQYCQRSERDPAGIDDAIRSAKAFGLIDDAALSRAIVRSGEGRGDSQAKLRMRLQRRGLAPAVGGDGYDEEEAFDRFVQRRRLEPALRAASDRTSRDKVLAKCLRAGFPSHLVLRWAARIDAER